MRLRTLPEAEELANGHGAAYEFIYDPSYVVFHAPLRLCIFLSIQWIFRNTVLSESAFSCSEPHCISYARHVLWLETRSGRQYTNNGNTPSNYTERADEMYMVYKKQVTKPRNKE